jgi:hypothetical protein
VSNPKVQDRQKSILSEQPTALKIDSANAFSEDKIRTRAYEIYESRGRTGNQADADWSQAEAELMELRHAK